MKSLVILLGTVLVAFPAADSSPISVDDSQEWVQFKLNHGKSYENDHVESQKKSIFDANKQFIEKFHKEAPEAKYFQLGLNHLADMSELEKRQLNGFKASTPEEGNELGNSQYEQEYLDAIMNNDGIEVPESLDWREVEGRVSSVKDQGQSCGSCWAFATTGALEGQESTHRNYTRPTYSGSLMLLSEQNLVDCAENCYGCDGGTMENAFRSIHQNYGINVDQLYPYEGKTGKCRFQKGKSGMTDRGAAVLQAGDEEALKRLVAKFGPVAVAIDAGDETFLLYRKGVYIKEGCGHELDELNHAVLIVGYGTDSKLGDYWIVKNSWGSSWGEEGYIRMARNRKNMCGIATRPTIPVF